MSEHPLDQFDVPTRVLKRAQYEAFAFELRGTDVLVRNESHACPDDHEYVVTIDDGLPATCTCPADEHSEYPCKHRVAIVIRSPILEFALEVQETVDSGVTHGVASTEQSRSETASSRFHGRTAPGRSTA